MSTAVLQLGDPFQWVSLEDMGDAYEGIITILPDPNGGVDYTWPTTRTYLNDEDIPHPDSHLCIFWDPESEQLGWAWDADEANADLVLRFDFMPAIGYWIPSVVPRPVRNPFNLELLVAATPPWEYD